MRCRSQRRTGPVRNVAVAAPVLLTEAHRQGQLAVRAAMTVDTLSMWRLFDIDDIGASWSALEPALVALIAVYGDMSAGLSAAYYEEFRAAQAVAGTPTPVLSSMADRGETIGNLRLVGPTYARQLVDAGRTDAASVTFTNVSGEMTRQVLNRGRDTLEGSLAADRQALGWARVTDGRPCAFCAMLASRGPVYSKQRGGFKAHGHCGCMLQPVYDQDAPWPGRAGEFRDMWNDATAGVRGPEASRLAFRQAYEGRSN